MGLLSCYGERGLTTQLKLCKSAITHLVCNGIKDKTVLHGFNPILLENRKEYSFPGFSKEK